MQVTRRIHNCWPAAGSSQWCDADVTLSNTGAQSVAVHIEYPNGTWVTLAGTPAEMRELGVRLLNISADALNGTE